MRVIQKNFTGFICGQYTRGSETAEGVMFYEEGRQTTLFVSNEPAVTSKLYRALKNFKADVAAALTKTIIRIN